MAGIQLYPKFVQCYIVLVAFARTPGQCQDLIPEMNRRRKYAKRKNMPVKQHGGSVRKRPASAKSKSQPKKKRCRAAENAEEDDEEHEEPEEQEEPEQPEEPKKTGETEELQHEEGEEEEIVEDDEVVDPQAEVLGLQTLSFDKGVDQVNKALLAAGICSS